MEKKQPIVVSAKVVHEPIRMGEPFYLNVTLENTGDSSVMINTRMSVGYRNSGPREIFIDFIEVATNQPAAFHFARINRDYSPISDYQLLQPGHSVSNTFNFFDYYNPLQAGKYKLVIYYQADEQYVEAPENLLHGTFASDTITLDILPAH